MENLPHEVTNLTVRDIQSLSQTQISFLFAEHLSPDDPPEKIALWLDSIKEPEIFRTTFRYVLWEQDEWKAQAGVWVSPFDEDAEIGLLKCRYFTDTLFSGLVTALCQSVISEVFSHGITNKVVAHTAHDNHLMQMLYASLSMTPSSENTDVSIENRISEGLLYEIRADNPEWSKWRPFEVFLYARDLMYEGDHVMEELEELMGMPRQYVAHVSE